jgi:hypothetical protein
VTTRGRDGFDPTDVRSHAHGRRFLTILVVPWVLGALLGPLCGLALGVGVAVGLGSGLAIALGLNFVWVVVVLAMDDGDINDEAGRLRHGATGGRDDISTGGSDHGYPT